MMVKARSGGGRYTDAMKQALILAGIAMLASASPAVAKPGKAKHNQGQHARVLDQGQGSLYGYGRGGCPPGLAKKNPQCMPPGQHKKMFGIGQRLPYDSNRLLGYNALPYDLRSQYGAQLDPYGRYYQQDNYLYRVDPTTMIVQQILGGLLRR